MAGSSQEKTEKPTGKRVTEARKKGNVAKSTDLNAVTVLLVGGLTTYFSTHHIYRHFRLIVEESWSGGFGISSGSTTGLPFFTKLISHFFLMIAPTITACMISAVAINFVQVGGFLFSFEAIKPKFSKLNPISGLTKFFSVRSLVELAKSLLKLLIIGHAAYSVFSSEQELLMSLTDREVVEILEVFGRLTLRILIRVGVIMVALSLLDYFFQRWQYTRDLKMTKQEIKEETKQSEGNPQIKSRIRSIQFSLARKRMMASVPKASVVITNPTHYAVALMYGPGMEAPQVVAKGANHLARKIIKIARENKVPVIQSPPLARALYQQVKLEESIPITLYKAVAKILAYIYQQKSHKPA